MNFGKTRIEFLGIGRVLSTVLLLATLAGCATTPQTTTYQIQSNVTDIDVYKGPSPDKMVFYTKAPFYEVAYASKYWSSQYFMARKPGYHDSEIIQQPTSAWGTPVNLHFFMRPKPVGTAAEFAPYAARGTVEAGDEFLKAYPETPIRSEVYAHMALQLPKDKPARDAALERLLGMYPGFSDNLTVSERLSWTGPQGLRVRDIQQLAKSPASVTTVEKRILASNALYKDFSPEELKVLKQMRVHDRLVAAMQRSTQASREATAKAEANARAAAAEQAEAAASMQRAAAAAAAAAAAQPVAATAPSADSMPTECVQLVAAYKACDRTGGFFAMACRMTADSQFKCPIPATQLLR